MENKSRLNTKQQKKKVFKSERVKIQADGGHKLANGQKFIRNKSLKFSDSYMILGHKVK